MERWTEFYLAEVGAAAALAGLLVVAISINISRIIAYGVLPGQAVHALVVITGTLAITSFGLLPDQTLRAFGLEVLLINIIMSFVGAEHLWSRLQARRIDASPFSWLLTTLVTLLLTGVPLLVGGVLLMRQVDAGLYWVAVAVIFSFVVTLLNGWVLLVEIWR